MKSRSIHTCYRQAATHSNLICSQITLQMLHVMDNSEPHDLMQNGEYPVQTRQGAGNKYALR